MSTRVLVADALSPDAFEDLRALGVEVEVQPDLTAADLPKQIAGYKVLVVRSTKVTAETIEAASQLALIVRAGSGTNNIDVDCASRKGVFVANCPGKNAIAVAELAMGLILAVDRRIPENVMAMHEQRWDKKTFSKASGLCGRKIGLVGFGAIARAVAERAASFGLQVTAFARSLTEAEADAAGVVRATSLENLLRSVDIVSLHLPATPQTKGLIGEKEIGYMKPGAMLINTARADVVDEPALIAAAKAGHIRVATDVYSDEPEKKATEYRSELGTIPHVVGTHHIGASTDQAQQAIADETVRIVRTFCEEGRVISPVNLELEPARAGTLVVRHLDKVGVLAHVLDNLKKASINVQTMQNIVFRGAAAACAEISLSAWPSDEVMTGIKAIEDVIHAEVL